MAVTHGEYSVDKITAYRKFGGIGDAKEYLEKVQDGFVDLSDDALKEHLGIDDDAEISSAERYVSTSELVDVLEKKGLFYVRFTPNFSRVYKDALKNPVRETLESGEKIVHKPQKVGVMGRQTTHRLKRDLIERMLEDVSRRRVANKFALKGRWYIDVGFLDPARRHVGAGGNNVSYAQLIMSLLALGYDPLLPLRKKKFIDSVGENMAKTLVDARNEYVLHKKTVNVKRKLETIAKRITDFAKEYIVSGQKPALARSTITTRKSRKKNNPSLYPEGINNPLVETEDLVADVWYRVVGANSYEIRKAELEEEKRRKEEARKIERTRKAAPKWRKHKEIAESQGNVSKYRRVVSIEEAQEDLQEEAKKNRQEARTSDSAKIKSGLFKGYDPNEQRSAFTIIRMFRDIYMGRNAFITRNQLTKADSDAFQMAKTFMTGMAQNVGMSLKEYLIRMGLT